MQGKTNMLLGKDQLHKNAASTFEIFFTVFARRLAAFQAPGKLLLLHYWGWT